MSDTPSTFRATLADYGRRKLAVHQYDAAGIWVAAGDDSYDLIPWHRVEHLHANLGTHDTLADLAVTGTTTNVVNTYAQP